jgi:anti-sigma regulatory factor (Ser/Thr protein kinase)
MAKSDQPAHNCWKLAALPQAASEARRHIRKSLANWGQAALIDTAELVTSELVTNALTAANAMDSCHQTKETCIYCGHITVHARRSPHHLTIEVWDPSPDPPRRGTPAHDDEHGRGLPLIAALTEAWGYHRPASGGKIVWCLLTLDQA